MRLNRIAVIFGFVLTLAVPSVGSAAKIALWLGGDTDAGAAAGNGIPTSIAHNFPSWTYQFVSTTDLATPGFLTVNAFDALVISRSGSSATGDLELLLDTSNPLLIAARPD